MNRLPQIAARRSRRIVLLLTIGTALLLLLLFLVGGVWVRSQAELALDRRLPDEALGWLAWSEWLGDGRSRLAILRCRAYRQQSEPGRATRELETARQSGGSPRGITTGTVCQTCGSRIVSGSYSELVREGGRPLRENPSW